ncbi:MAG TPA: hypothetical protein VNQ90_04510 [Chthoniobacteraceae bacterium]|nr:hypothetical protein [Chthoniobacteraceae bacterium]
MLFIAPFLCAAALAFATPARAASTGNNFVQSLVQHTVEPGNGKEPLTLSFDLPRDGWVHLRIEAESAPVRLQLDRETTPPLQPDAKGSLPEQMRRLAAGKHTLTLTPQKGGQIREVSIRSVPEMVYFSVDHHSAPVKTVSHAIIREYRDLKEAGILDNFNIIASEPYSELPAYLEKVRRWRARGRWWITVSKTPRKPDSSEEVEHYWASPMGDPDLDGVIIDEFGLKEKHLTQFPFWARSLRELAQRPALKGKQFYAFTGFGKPELYRPLAEALMDGDYRIAPEIYLRRMHLLEKTPERMRQWREAVPGIERRMVLFLGPDNIAPSMTFHLEPEMNYKAFLDEQFHLFATDPAFKGLAGLGIWAARYMDDDILRWYARLVRHYLIEGHTTRLGSDPLYLTHLQNPGFEQEGKGWELQPGAGGNIGLFDVASLPFTKSPYSAVPEGKRMLLTRRGPKEPNRITQTIRDLQPGRVYHVNVYALDVRDPARKELLPLSVNVRGAERLNATDRTHEARSAKNPPKKGPEDDAFIFTVDTPRHRLTWHHFHRLFKATSTTALLELSDEGAQEGAEIAWDFIELAPDVSLQPLDAPL